MSNLFNEASLRAAIVSVWGEHGAHIDVFDHMLGLIATADPVLEANAASSDIRSSAMAQHPAGKGREQ
jgi:hypothetical protein